MSQQPLLKTFFQQRYVDAAVATPFDKFVGCSLNADSLDPCLVEQLIPLADLQKNSSPWLLIEKWRETLVLLVFLRDRDLLQTFKTLLLERVRQLNDNFLWPEFQLISTFRAVCAFLLKQESTSPPTHQLPSGAAPLEWGGHWSWGDVPHTRFHAELGILWCMYGRLTSDSAYLKLAERLAEWQLNTLDHDYAPFMGLFSQEGHAAESSLVINNFLLFSAVAGVFDRKDLAFAAVKQRERLNAMSSGQRFPIPHSALAFEKIFFDHGYEVISETHPLPRTFADKQMILAGCRSAETSAVATLYGGGSGMGCLHRNDVQIVSFGPQHLPLGDCRGFGIEGQHERLSSSKVAVSELDGTFSIEGTARLAPRPKVAGSNATFQNGEHSGFWIDAKQCYNKEKFSIEMIFRGVFDLNTLAFAFFVKAQSCIVDARQIIRPRSFERYQGEVRPTRFRGKQISLEIDAGQKAGGMQVIPLGGGDNFWGADFLVAYLLDPHEAQYSWVIK